MSWSVVVPVLVVLAALRVVGAGLFLWVVAWWVGLYVTFQYGFTTPIPQSAVEIYMGISTLALFAYVCSTRERIEGFFGPIRRVIVEPRFTPLLVIIALLLPAAAGWRAYRGSKVPVEAPFFARSVHPSPPTTIEVHGDTIDLVGGENPFLALAESDPDAYRERVRNGRNTYYRNCFYCHGDGLAGDGLFAHGLNPIPTNFTDAGVLPNFQSSFFFWRVAKGGPGLPDEGGPWESAMPRWEDFLSEDEIWEVVLFLYDFTGYRPRQREEFH